MNVSLTSLAFAQTPEPTILADSAILIEASTGRVIYEKNADVARPPASMTKMMTCILAIENLTKRTLVPIPNDAIYTEDNTFNWTQGDVIQADELMLGMMLVSDNGAAVALAEAISGSVPQFAALMNERARELGCTNTNFANPNGLPNDRHYSTARDMAKIAQYGMTVPDFRDIVATKTAVIHWNAPVGKMTSAETTNELIGVYNGMTGIKTGWTMAAGGCLAASAKRNDIELIAIIMHSTDTHTRFEDATKLLDYGFGVVKMTKGIEREKIEKVVFIRDGKKATVRVKPLEDLTIPLLDGEDAKKLKLSYDLPKFADASIKKGQTLGNVELKCDGKTLGTVPLVAQDSVEKGFNIYAKIIGLAAAIMPSFLNVFSV